MELPIFQVDAFATEVFKGNPAAVVLLPNEIPESIMQEIASENNLSETAFVRLDLIPFEIRWFTPTTEVDLCGHATLASAFVLFTEEIFQEEVLNFQSKTSGILKVKPGDNGSLTLDFPVDNLQPSSVKLPFLESLGGTPEEVWEGSTDLILRYSHESLIKNMKPDFAIIREWPYRGVIVTAQADDSNIDFVSRFFGPAVGVDEDPVTGSAHTSLTPFWADKLGKDRLIGKQISQRGGTVFCKQKGNRVQLSGFCQCYMRGSISI